MLDDLKKKILSFFGKDQSPDGEGEFDEDTQVTGTRTGIKEKIKKSDKDEFLDEAPGPQDSEKDEEEEEEESSGEEGQKKKSNIIRLVIVLAVFYLVLDMLFLDSDKDRSSPEVTSDKEDTPSESIVEKETPHQYEESKVEEPPASEIIESLSRETPNDVDEYIDQDLEVYSEDIPFDDDRDEIDQGTELTLVPDTGPLDLSGESENLFDERGEEEISEPSTAGAFEEIVRMVEESRDQEIEKEYVAPPNYQRLGRGLVYNCVERHWACVNRESYLSCYGNKRWAEHQGSAPECVPANVYASDEDCRIVQAYNVNTGANTDFCR